MELNIRTSRTGTVISVQNKVDGQLVYDTVCDIVDNNNVGWTQELIDRYKTYYSSIVGLMSSRSVRPQEWDRAVLEVPVSKGVSVRLSFGEVLMDRLNID